MTEITLRPVGFVVESPLTRDGPHLNDLSEVRARIELDATLVDGLQGLEVGQRIDLIVWLHEVSDEERAQLRIRSKRHPEQSKGVFAARRPQRPNPIGVTRVQLVEMDGASLVVVGCDAFPGTPILDIKPGQDRLRSGARVS